MSSRLAAPQWFAAGASRTIDVARIGPALPVWRAPTAHGLGPRCECGQCAPLPVAIRQVAVQRLLQAFQHSFWPWDLPQNAPASHYPLHTRLRFLGRQRRNRRPVRRRDRGELRRHHEATDGAHPSAILQPLRLHLEVATDDKR